MDTGLIITIILISAMGGFIQRVSGFGFGIFVMLFLPYLVTPHTAASAISTIISCIMSGYNAFTYRKHVPFKKIIPLIVGAVIMIPLAVRFSVVISADFFKRLLGIALMILSIYFICFNQRFKIKPTFLNGVLAGGMGGVLNGLFSTGGPPIVLYLMSSIDNNLMYFASAQCYFCVTGIYSITVRALNGVITPDVLIYAAIGFFGCIFGNIAGKYTFDKLNANMLRKIVYFGMLASGLIMAVK